MKKLQKGKNFQIFNLGTGRSVKINKLFNLIEKNIGVKGKIKKRKLEKFDPKKSSGKYKKFLRFFNLKKYNFTELEDGLVETINYMKKEN